MTLVCKKLYRQQLLQLAASEIVLLMLVGVVGWLIWALLNAGVFMAVLLLLPLFTLAVVAIVVAIHIARHLYYYSRTPVLVHSP